MDTQAARQALRPLLQGFQALRRLEEILEAAVLAEQRQEEAAKRVSELEAEAAKWDDEVRTLMAQAEQARHALTQQQDWLEREAQKAQAALTAELESARLEAQVSRDREALDWGQNREGIRREIAEERLVLERLHEAHQRLLLQTTEEEQRAAARLDELHAKIAQAKEAVAKL